MTRPRYIVSLDVETVGLHGQPFAWAATIWDTQKLAVKVEVELLVTCPLEAAQGHPDDREWVMGNVLPALEQLPPALAVEGSATVSATVRKVSSVEDLLNAFVIFWNAWSVKKGGAWLLVDHGYPVEAEFLFESFMESFQRKTEFKIPYPVIDYASMRAGHGLDPVETLPRTGFELPVHNPLADARQTLRLALELWNWTVAVDLRLEK